VQTEEGGSHDGEVRTEDLDVDAALKTVRERREEHSGGDSGQQKEETQDIDGEAESERADSESNGERGFIRSLLGI
jgi:hypothetical protein